MKTLKVRTDQRAEMLDITDLVKEYLEESGTQDGQMLVYVTHTTCGVTINENADPDVCTDLLMALDKLVPWEQGFRHMEGNSAAHLKASLMGSSCTVPVQDGKLQLGIWQGIYLCEFDGPRNRNVLLDVR